MRFSQTQLRVIWQLGIGNKNIEDIAKSLNLSSSQIYRVANELQMQGIIQLKNSTLEPQPKTHISMLLKLMSKSEHLANPLSGNGIQILIALLEPKKVQELGLKLHKTTIFKKISQARNMSLLLVNNKTYQVNYKLWSDLKEFILELKKYEEQIDARVPINSKIYFKTEQEIVFSNVDTLDAQKTAFSSYEDYGIKLFMITNYYYLPKKQLSKLDVFEHSLHVTNITKEIRHYIFVALFYAKFKKELLQVKHPILDNLNKIFNGEVVPRYPILAEIKDRAQVYNIEL